MPAYSQALNGFNSHKGCLSHLAIAQACTRVGFNFEDVLVNIHHYAVRNELLHSNLLSFIKHGLDNLKKGCMMIFAASRRLSQSSKSPNGTDDQTSRGDDKTLLRS